MACYDYMCPSCGWEGTLYNVKIDERDKQKCPTVLELNGEGEWVIVPEWGITPDCSGYLVRTEEIGTTSWKWGKK